jgi:hypothetical protein
MFSRVQSNIDWKLSGVFDEGLSIMGVRGQRTNWNAWYSSRRWARILRHQLLEHPLCREPHRGDVNKFWLGPFQSLCKPCHDSSKRFVRHMGFAQALALMAGRRTRTILSRPWALTSAGNSMGSA